MILLYEEYCRMNKTVLTSFTILCLLSTMFPNGLTLNIQTVKARTIYIRVDGSIDPSDAPISRNDNFTYTLTGNINDSIIVEKGSIVVDGSGYTLQGAGNIVGFYWFDVNNVTIKNTNIKGFEYGVDCISTSLSDISGNNITNSDHGINLYSSSNNNIYGNTVTNSHHGIRLIASSNNILSGNNITNSYHGVYLSSSSNNTVSANTVTSNNYFGVFFSSSSNNTVSANTITSNNDYGLYLSGSSDNRFYHNNFIGNTEQVRIRVPSYADFWDNGVEGNYWSDYTGDDIYSGPYQNETGNDGVGDTLYLIDENNTDHYPLMGMFSSFNTSLNYHVNVVSNSTVEDFIYFESNSTIRMHISNMTTNQTFGFCRVCIPKKLMPPPYTVVINDGLTEVLHFNDTIYDNGTHRWAYFSYEHSTLEIIIIPEFPSLTILPLFMIAMLLAVTVYKRNALQRKKD